MSTDINDIIDIGLSFDLKDIDAVSDVDALAALYEYSGDPLVRPLGEFPVL